MCVSRRFVFVAVLLLSCTLLLVSLVLLATKHIGGSDLKAPLEPAEHLDVRIDSGTVRGRLQRSHFERRPFYSFEGLPYARPPTGDEGRFRPPRPLPADAWNGTVLECFEHGPMCLQTNFATGGIMGSEDCLTLNVYAPVRRPGQPLLPIMVHLFGGGFYRSAPVSTTYGADFLVDHSVILVTVQNRLGALGLLAVDEDAEHTSGNWHLKDQQFALRWVQRNIAGFGGDAGRVTLAGLSSGSLSIQLHQQAPGSRGLFHRTIEMSTSFDARAVFRPRPVGLTDQLRQIVFEELRINVSDSSVGDLMVALRRMDAGAFVRHFPFVQYHTPLMPTIESQLALDAFVQGDRPGPFAMEEPFDIDMPVLTGYTTNEAKGQSTKERWDAFRKSQRIDIPSIHFQHDYESDKYRLARDKIFKRYIASEAGAANATLGEYVRLYSDVFQGYALDRKVRALARWNRGPTWFYQFDLRTAINVFEYAAETPEAKALPGAAHMDDVCYVFYCGGRDQLYQMYREAEKAGSVERRLIERMSGLYAGFVWGVDPEWEPVRPSREANTTYMHMGMKGFVQKENPMGDGRKFWDDIVREFGYEDL